MIRLFVTFCCLAIAASVCGQAPIQVTDGFEITKVAGDELATNIYTLTIDSNGHTVVAGPGYVKRLIDRNADGVFDDFQLVSEFPKNGAQGLYFDGSTLYAVGDQGVLRMTDNDGDGVCDPPTVVWKVKTGGEHDAHAIRKGPDDKWYLLCGNHVPFPADELLGDSLPFKLLKVAHAGHLLEINKDFTKAEVHKWGFRNAYDFDFNSDGDVFTYDSDGERDVSLPWYQPTRVYRMSKTYSDAGWVTASWKQPDYLLTTDTIGRLGRGSPTGVVCYRHFQFPKSYFDALFVLDWTAGRIIVHRRDPQTGEYDQGSLFASPKGTSAFAVTDAEVAPDGSLLVSVGGRGTEGAVYRISSVESRSMDFDQPQVNSSWARKSRAKLDSKVSWSNTIERLNSPRMGLDEKLALIETTCQGAEMALTVDEFHQVKSDDRRLISKLVWAAKQSVDKATFTGVSADLLGRVQRLEFGSGVSDLENRLRDNTARFGDESRPAFWSSTWVGRTEDLRIRLIDHLLPVHHTKREVDNNWPAIFDGYYVDDRMIHPRKLSEETLGEVAIAMKASRGTTLNEWARRLAIWRQTNAEIQSSLLEQITPTSDPVRDIHFLICLTRSMQRPTSSQLSQLVDGLISVRSKIEARQLPVDKHWVPRMRELARVMIREFKVSELISTHPDIALPENFYLVEVLSQAEKELVQIQIADFVLQDPNRVSSQQLGFLAEAPSNIFCGLLRSFGNESGMTDAVVRSLARNPIAEDREVFLRGLRGVNRNTWRLSAIGLRKIKSLEVNDSLLIYRKLASLGSDNADERVRKELHRFLVDRYRDRGGAVEQFDIDQWSVVLEKEHPEAFSQMQTRFGSTSKVLERLQNLDAAEGDVDRGKEVFGRLSCAKCHDGGDRLGPSLAGISNRFSNGDIVDAIVNPDRLIPARYRAEKILTVDGEFFYGSVVYESAEGVVLTDRQNNTLRINRSDIEERTTSETSLMPPGLLDDASEQDVADLLAYLKTLK